MPRQLPLEEEWQDTSAFIVLLQSLKDLTQPALSQEQLRDLTAFWKVVRKGLWRKQL
jgi:hypothetical protein